LSLAKCVTQIAEYALGVINSQLPQIELPAGYCKRVSPTLFCRSCCSPGPCFVSAL